MDRDRERAKELFEQMPVKEKIGYVIQNYYRLFIVVAVVLAIVIGFIGNLTWRKGPDSALGVGLHANVLDFDLAQTAAEDLGEEYPFMEEDGRAIYSYWFYSGYNPSQAQQIESTAYQLAGAIAAQQLDILVGDRETLETDCQFRYTMPLTDLFSEEELAAIGEQEVVSLSFDITNDIGRTMEKVRDVPYLIRVSGRSETIDNVMLENETYLAVVANAQNKEEIRKFVFALLDIQ